MRNLFGLLGTVPKDEPTLLTACPRLFLSLLLLGAQVLGSLFPLKPSQAPVLLGETVADLVERAEDVVSSLKRVRSARPSARLKVGTVCHLAGLPGGGRGEEQQQVVGRGATAAVTAGAGGQHPTTRTDRDDHRKRPRS